MTRSDRPFEAFAGEIRGLSETRAHVADATRRPEREAVATLLEAATLGPEAAARVRANARALVEALREKRRGGGVEALIHEYALSSQEGVALMCLAEALLRVPDDETRDALIRDKLAAGDWLAHVGHSPSLFVNAATWGLVVSGKLAATNSERGLAAALARLIARGGEPLIRKGVDLAMRMMGEQFVSGRTIDEAIANARAREARGYRHSYDMLGEAAVGAQDARRYYDAYAHAIAAIGRASAGRGIYDGPGISIKLSALHPRYCRAQRARVTGELLPRLLELVLLAREADIGLNIDAEEADRLEISLELLEAVCEDPRLRGWNGVGFVVQAYSKRCPAVIAHLIALARRTRRRLMVRLVKGAYWDSEIKRAQVDGMEDFPVFTRKAHTDLCFIACARSLLAAPDAIYPQFATHNAQTLASIVELAGEPFRDRQYEFQCLHGMGEPLYDEVIAPDGLARPCRIYAPVGTHETLLAYLVRRLLENGANTSFVNRINDASIAIDTLIADPADEVRASASPGAPHPAIALPRALFGAARVNSGGIDLASERELARLAGELLDASAGAGLVAEARAAGAGAAVAPAATPTSASAPASAPLCQRIVNPADHDDVVGSVVVASDAQIEAALARAAAAAPRWSATPAAQRARLLERAADLLQQRMPALIGLVVREAGKSIPNAVGEVREAVDFLRYYAHRLRVDPRDGQASGLGALACISPWNFPLAIFTGQVAAALAAGNAVLAKPAEQTPLVAALAVDTLLRAGIADDVVQLLPGGAEVGAALVA
ncbi:MAG: bifunctional proline dehydrogenase/L-glutamate gamma-semialdehyde dehydrogenase PutA, partial [Burkholderiaceae bacterium]|nr:bifunctional proline dehydrogenase/L-glutamate gamma-semialdehyde dehydrogenase PutA [Burkholderiaceae bacterium]